MFLPICFFLFRINVNFHLVTIVTIHNVAFSASETFFKFGKEQMTGRKKVIPRNCRLCRIPFFVPVYRSCFFFRNAIIQYLYRPDHKGIRKSFRHREKDENFAPLSPEEGFFHLVR